MFDIYKQIILANIKAQHDGKYIAPIILSGSPGIAKSSTIKQVCEENNFSLVNRSCAALLPETLSGIPDFHNDTSMDKYSDIGACSSQYTQWSLPELIYQANKLAEHNPTVVLLDDFHSMPPASLPYMYEMLLERKLGQYKFNNNVAIVSTMNNSDEANFNGMPSPVRNRVGILDFKLDFDQWFLSVGRYMHHYVSSFLRAHQNYWMEEESVSTDGFGTPRSFHFLSEQLKTLPIDLVNNHANLLAKQYISTDASISFNKHVNYLMQIDFTSKLNAKTFPDFSTLPPQDEILWSYIINYVQTIEHAQHVVNIVNRNMKYELFIGYLVGEIFTKYLQLDSVKVSPGIKALIHQIMELPEWYNSLSADDKHAVNNLRFDDWKQFTNLGAEYVVNL